MVFGGNFKWLLKTVSFEVSLILHHNFTFNYRNTSQPVDVGTLHAG